ncbi:hypothetical protein ALI144C_08015 [Actinosynnema sp. ALI-1.44]|uniref:nSTAND1 domain-containing NTPase n=1 Tax=Actinosynnema sp. ALI-1.44 TaxID=1933779 RepID=UPI00097CB7B9|nr:TIR domain-containing protein [Actinosynnema sp. ALI-1.44]ONI87873.1 hypothetical protein ALI144C_08015 [Actinosynnema sp. ALI-1.44]
MGGVFVNFRAGDGDWAATLIARELSARFGDEHVFLASRSIRPGEDSVRTVHESLVQCDVLLTVIGSRWRDAGNSRDGVHTEIAEAFRHGLRVIPVFLDHMSPMAEADLPADIAALARSQYLRLSHRNDAQDLDRLVGELAGLIPDLALTRIVTPVRPPNRSSLPSTWLRAEHEIVPFAGRDTELADLVAWIDAPDLVSARLMTGPTGQGKTRLALRLCQELAERGWVAGIVHDRAAETDLAAVGEINSPLLLVVDDAETQVSQVQAVATALSTRAATAQPARLLLVSREVGDWLRGLYTLTDDRVAGLFRALVDQPLAPLVSSTADRQAEFRRATTAYGGFLGFPRTDHTPPADLTQSRYVGVREIHANALVTLLRAHASSDAVPTPDPELLRAARPGCPYRGLRPFQEQDAALFHGRDKQVRQLSTELERHGLVMVVGASGSGKSSLVRAGILPLLRQQDAAVAVFRPTPGIEPAELLAHALGPVVGTEPTAGLTAERIPSLASVVVDAVGRLVLFVDQFEELVATDPATARELLDLVARLVRAGPAEPPALCALFTARSADVDEVLTPEVAPVLRMVAVPRMAQAELRIAVAGPADLPLASFEPGLVDRILADAADAPGQLPLVEFVLTLLWESRQGEMLTHQAYDDQGGVAGALAAYAQEVYTEQLLPNEQRLAEALLVQLARPDEHDAFTLTPARLDQLDAEAQALTRKLAAHRLVVIRQDPGHPEVVALAHEALIEQWRQLRDWLVAARDFRSWQEQLRTALGQWRRSDNDPETLLRGAALATAEDWLAERPTGLTDGERDYVVASRARQRRGVRRWWAITALIATLALVAGVAAVIAANQNDELTEQLRRAAAVTLGQEAARRAETDPLAALQFAQAAWRHDPDNRDAYAALLQHYLRNIDVEEIRSGLWEGPVAMTAGTVDGQVVAVAGPDGRITLWTGLLDRAPQRWFLATISNLYRLTLSPDGRWLAAVTGDGGITLWDIGSRGAPVALRQAGPREGVDPVQARSADFALDGSTLVVTLKQTNVGSNLVEIWDVAQRQPVAHGVAPPRALRDVSVRQVAPNGTSAWFGEHGVDGTRRNVLRDFASGAVLREVPADFVTRDGVFVECQNARLSVRDATTGAVRFTRAVLECPGTDAADITDLSGRYAVFRLGSPEHSFQQIQLVDLQTGKSYSLRSRPTDRRTGERHVENIIALGNESAPPTVFAFDTGALLRLRAAGPAGDLPPFTPSKVPGSTALSPDGRLITTTDQFGLLAFESDTRRMITGGAETLEVVQSPPPIFTADGRYLLVLGKSTEVIVISVPDFTVRRRIALPTAYDRLKVNYFGVDFSILPLTDDDVAVVMDEVCTRWRPSTGELLGENCGPYGFGTRRGNWGRTIRWPANPHEVLVVSSGGFEIWDLIRKAAVRTFHQGPDNSHPAVVIDSAALRVAAHFAPAGQLVLWSPDRSAESRTIPLPGDVSPVAFAPDGKLITGSGNGELQVWGLDARGHMATVRSPGQPAGWSSYAGTLVAVTEFGPQLIDMNFERWLGHLCRINNRDYTPEERALLPSGADSAPPCAAASRAEHTTTPLRVSQ